MDYIVQSGELTLVIEKNLRQKSDTVIEQLVAIRKEKKMTQQDIADVTGMARANVARIEGKKYVPTLEVLLKYANSLGYDIDLKLLKKDE